MSFLNSLLSSRRLPNINVPRPNLNLPCEVTIEFFNICGHTVSTRRCRNPARIGQNSSAESACNETCRSRNLPTLIHMQHSCAWCRSLPPRPHAVRSDPGVDRLDPGEIRKRQDFYLSQPRPNVGPSTRNQFFQYAGMQARWELFKRTQHEFADSLGVGLGLRPFFTGGGHDVRLFIPIDRSTITDDEQYKCLICFLSLGEGAAPVALPCHGAHHFHIDCIDEWIPPNNTCPMCRAMFTLSPTTFEAWEEVERDRPYVPFFFMHRVEPPFFHPDVDGVSATRALIRQQREEQRQLQLLAQQEQADQPGQLDELDDFDELDVVDMLNQLDQLP